jgi:DNA-binding IclR family transcriptional regulator
MRTGKPATRHLAAVERATSVLDALGAAARPLGTNEIARLTSINPSTVSRLLATLVAAGYAEHDAVSGRYRLGGRIVALAQQALGRLDLRQLVRPLLEGLVEQTGETATLSLPTQTHPITADFVPGRGSVISVARVGRPSLLHATAVGKVMLAFGPNGTSVLSYPLEPLTDRTITAASHLETEVDGVRRRGYATAVGEREPDLNAVAVPVFDRAPRLVAILGLQGPATRLTPRQLVTDAAALVRAAADASHALSANVITADPELDSA